MTPAEVRTASITAARLAIEAPGPLPQSFDQLKPLLQRAAVNYLRHVWTDYDRRVSSVQGHPRRQLEILWEVLNELAGMYPWLLPECQRQVDARQRWVQSTGSYRFVGSEPRRRG